MGRIKRRIFKIKAVAKTEIFNDAKLFYKQKRRHGNNNGLLPEKDEKQCLII